MPRDRGRGIAGPQNKSIAFLHTKPLAPYKCTYRIASSIALSFYRASAVTTIENKCTNLARMNHNFGNRMTSKPTIADPVARAASRSTGKAPANGWAAVIPELGVDDIQASLSFWCDLLGFEVAYDRPDARFSFLVRGDAQLMLCERNGRWEIAEMQRPFGRGINFQIHVECIDPVLAALNRAEWPIYEQPSEAWYRVGNHEYGQREFLVQDPDGYLMRFAESLGKRPPRG